MILYGIPNCNTVKKAMDWLKAAGISYEFHDFKKKGVTEAKLTEWYEVFGWEKVINRSGLTFKKLDKEAQSAIDSPQKASAYLVVNTSAVKRPILEKDGKALCLGFQEEVYEALVK